MTTKKNSSAKMSPGRRQYLDIKNKYDDCLLLFRMGDFYETFDKDAKLASDILGIRTIIIILGVGLLISSSLTLFTQKWLRDMD